MQFVVGNVLGAVSTHAAIRRVNDIQEASAMAMWKNKP